MGICYIISVLRQWRNSPRTSKGWYGRSVRSERRITRIYHSISSSQFYYPVMISSLLIISAGAYVFLSRTDPCIDPILENGLLQKPPDMKAGEEAKDVELQPSQWMKAKVYSKGNKFIRIIIPTAIENMGRGHWR